MGHQFFQRRTECRGGYDGRIHAAVLPPSRPGNYPDPGARRAEHLLLQLQLEYWFYDASPAGEGDPAGSGGTPPDDGEWKGGKVSRGWRISLPRNSGLQWRV